MTKHYKLSLHIFRRDLRLQDNTALIEALRNSETVIPCFIIDKRQVESNDYKSDACLQFMAASLAELDVALQKKNSRLYLFYGTTEEVVANLLNAKKINAVFVNRDYTPFSRTRDAKLADICNQHGTAFHSHADALLHEPEECLKANLAPYTVFTHFFRRASEFSVSPPQQNRHDNYYQQNIAGSEIKILENLIKQYNPKLALKGGRNEALRLLKKIPELKDYQMLRNIPEKDAGTHLSAHHKFGTISIRETYAGVVNAFSRHHTLINELYWRDFFTHIAYHFPRVFSGAFNEKYNALSWQDNMNFYKKWCSGMTGFPIVDAGMRELNATGYMHNRVRMITASFLTKDLHIDWRLGEKYFAQHLVDYDPAVNNGNWQWCASTGCDAQPYFRIFNPWLQQKKFDPDCIYIKRWIPELAQYTPAEIHKLSTQLPLHHSNYPAPILDHSVESKIASNMFKNLV